MRCPYFMDRNFRQSKLENHRESLDLSQITPGSVTRSGLRLIVLIGVLNRLTIAMVDELQPKSTGN
jgi:hypothetical protein